MHEIVRLLESFYCTPWAILDSHLKHFEMQLLQAYKVGSLENLVPENRTAKGIGTTTGGIGVLPIQGPIGHRANFLSDYFGFPTTERLGQSFQQMVDDPSIAAIVLDINSPGGMAVGNEELHQLILGNKGKKPVVAVANGMAASAAYYIASAADQIVVTPSGEVGSIGCVMVHGDMSQMYADAGVNITVVKAGKYKWEGHPYEPLSEEALAQLQSEVDAHYGMFVNAVAKGRGVSAATVKNDFGQGRMLMAADAKKAGMVDRIDTLEGTIARLGSSKKFSMTGIPGSSQFIWQELVTTLEPVLVTPLGSGGKGPEPQVNFELERLKNAQLGL